MIHFARQIFNENLFIHYTVKHILLLQQLGNPDTKPRHNYFGIKTHLTSYITGINVVSATTLTCIESVKRKSI